MVSAAPTYLFPKVFRYANQSLSLVIFWFQKGLFLRTTGKRYNATVLLPLPPKKHVRHPLCHTPIFKRSGFGETAALFGEAEITSCTPSQQHVGKIKLESRCWTGRSVCHDRRRQ